MANQAALDKTHFFTCYPHRCNIFGGLNTNDLLKFVRLASLGSIIWVLICVLAGYFFDNIPLVKNHLGTITIMGLAMVILFFVLSKLWHQFSKL
jgi:membrane-associated protein